MYNSAIRPLFHDAEVPVTKHPTTLEEVSNLDENELQPQDHQD